MKNTLLLCCAIFLFVINNSFAQNSHKRVVVGIDKNENFSIINKEQLVEKWESRLKKEGFDVKITAIELVTNTNHQIIIVGTNIDRTVKVAISVYKENHNYYQNLNIPSITCVGTSTGCYPQLEENSWSCSPSKGGMACSKIESVEVL